MVKDIRDKIKDYKRIVIKVGTSTLTYDTGKINLNRIEKIARVLSDLVNRGKEVVLVSSGAIGVGVGKLNLKKKPRLIGEKQAIAAVGQCELMHIYSRFFAEYSNIVAQILLTREVIESKASRENIINTFNNLLERGIVPIVNENDSVSIEELEYGTKHIFGDNDTLSAYVARLIEADLLILLSDIDGFYDANPKGDNSANLISVINEITPDIEEFAGGIGSNRGTGGMVTKIEAAKIALESDIVMIIANGNNPCIIADIIEGKRIGSLFAKI